MKICIYSLIIGLFFLSCTMNRSDNESDEISIINISCEKNQILNLSEFADSIEIIPLETRDDNLIGWIPRIIATTDKYYISSAIGYNYRKLLVFDKQGKFIQQIGKQGQGPQEYIEMKDFTLLNDSIIMMSEVYNMISYSLNGDFLKKVKQEETPLEIYSLKGNVFTNTFLPSKCNNHLLRVLDDEGKFTSYALRLSPLEAHVCGNIVGDAGFTSDKDHIFYTYPYSPIIYKLNIETLDYKPAYRIDYGNRNVSWKIFEEYDSREWQDRLRMGNDYMAVNGILDMGNKMVINSADGDYLFYFSIYSKETGKVLCGQIIRDDLFFKGNQMKLKAFMLPHCSDGNCLLWTIKPKVLLNGYRAYREALGESKWLLFCKKYPRLVEVCEQLDEESNPVLLKIKIKDF